jgi:hypothetical protein
LDAKISFVDRQARPHMVENSAAAYYFAQIPQQQRQDIERPTSQLDRSMTCKKNAL